MTDDCISRLSEIRSKYNCFDENEEPYYRALSEAINILYLRADGDTISRHAAINVIGIIHDPVMEDRIIEHIKLLPSAQPEREKGTWIKKMRVTETEKYTSYESEWYCPCCGTKYDPHIAQFVNFCYVCGLDLREGKEEE